MELVNWLVNGLFHWDFLWVTNPQLPTNQLVNPMAHLSVSWAHLPHLGPIQRMQSTVELMYKYLVGALEHEWIMTVHGKYIYVPI